MYITPYFTNIEAQVIEQICSAQQSIYIAVAWFTNTRIMNALIQQVETHPGIAIQIVVDNNEVNQKYFVNRSHAMTNAGIIIKDKADGQFLHHKFMVIDQQRVMFGSYNFTGKANTNAENLNLVNDALIAKHFIKEFKMLTDSTYIDENIQLLLRYPMFAQQLISANYPFSSIELKKYRSRIAVGHCFLADNGYYDALHYEPGFIFNPICSPIKEDSLLPNSKRVLEEWHTNLVMEFGRDYHYDHPEEIDGLGDYMARNLQTVTEFYTRKFEHLYPVNVLEKRILDNVNIIIETQLWTVNFAPFINPHSLNLLMNTLPDRSNDVNRKNDVKLIRRASRKRKSSTNNHDTDVKMSSDG
ncbi:DUF1669 domain-containing protein [Chitinophaga oryzae]|uniref:phospholipase D n=1 Tax=Chitinophaga oryzae TaxID=2725414 RepID=A0AAE6ZME8_9BACT|nr:phospholipase D-like domain-containing protein [Chitinophaga oryzae]QJB35919.1 DUF1669 domain-containing protein [Chitinophaga oryzae]